MTFEETVNIVSGELNEAISNIGFKLHVPAFNLSGEEWKYTKHLYIKWLPDNEFGDEGWRTNLKKGMVTLVEQVREFEKQSQVPICMVASAEGLSKNLGFKWQPIIKYPEGNTAAIYQAWYDVANLRSIVCELHFLLGVKVEPPKISRVEAAGILLAAQQELRKHGWAMRPLKMDQYGYAEDCPLWDTLMRIE